MTDVNIPRLLPRVSAAGPRVTVVMPTYRRSQQIGATIHSLLGGTWSDFEILVRDDGDGSDGTVEAVAGASKGDPRVRYHWNGGRLGMPGNLNAGIVESRGELVAVCHDHDLYAPSFLTEMVETLSKYPTALFVHCAIDVITQTGTYVRSHIGNWSELSPGHSWLQLMLRSFHCPVCALTVVRREAHERYGLYDSSCGFIADVEMWMRLAMHGDVAYVRHPLVQIREREEGHAAGVYGLSVLHAAARIHRRYIPYAYGARECLFRRLLLEMRLACQMSQNQAALVKALVKRRALRLVKV